MNSNHGCLSGDGFEILSEVLSAEECDRLANELGAIFKERWDSSRKLMGGVRNILRLSPLTRELATSSKLTSAIGRLTCIPIFPVRAVFFDKTAEANWSAPWHQDMAIAVVQRIDTEGFGPWSVKDGIVHVQPPCEILGSMVAVRIHLDDCFAENGALKVIPGSHLDGELSSEAIDAWTAEHQSVTCELPKGGVMAMRPLLLHASTRATNPTHRRVVHIEYATGDLPNGLKWFEE